MSGKDFCVTESFFITHWLERERLESCYVSRKVPSNYSKSLKNIEAVGPLKTGSQ